MYHWVCLRADSRVSQDSVEGMVVGFWVFYGSITRVGPVLWFTLDCTFPILTCNKPSYNIVVCIAPVVVDITWFDFLVLESNM